jgi:RNA polymerase sigma-70 factor, ECF subfamily
LVEAAMRGDRAALDAVFREHLPALTAFVRLRIGPSLGARESTADLVQSACREVLVDLEDFNYRTEADFGRWLYAAALRKIINRASYHRAEKRDQAREVPFSGGSRPVDEARILDCYRRFCSPSQDAIAREEIQHIEAAFATLSDEHREVILLSRLAGLPHQEVAARLGRSEVAVRSLLSRALARLARALATGRGE